MVKKVLFGILSFITFSVFSQNLLNDPQKIVIDAAHDRYLVSNFMGGGDLVQISTIDGCQSLFVENAGMIDGMHIVNNVVYGSGTGGNIFGYDLDTGEQVMNLDVPGVTHFSSFISDADGFIYTSERFGQRIFKVDLVTETYSVFAQGGGIDQPNGLLLEPEYNRMLVCMDKTNPPIYAIDMTDQTITLIATTSINGSDGIAKDLNGNYYLTGYYLPGIYKFPPDFSGEPELFYTRSFIVYPTYNSTNNSFLVTLYNSDDWAEIPLDENVLNNPESVTYDSLHNRYLVSNIGDGRIIQIDYLGQQTFFSTLLDYTFGLHILDNKLYVPVNDGSYQGVVGYDLDTRCIVFHSDILEKELLNDITSDSDGNLYVTDCDTDIIYKVNTTDETYSAFVSSGLDYPNGLLYDPENNRLLVSNCLLPGRPISAVDLSDGTVSTVVNTNINAVDGLAVDNDGRTYFSSWETDKVYRYDPLFTNPPEVVSDGHSDPADICINNIHNILAVPNYTSNIVDFISLSGISVNEASYEFDSFQFYPNPFNDKLFLNIKISEKTQMTVSIFNLHGQKIMELLNNELQKGEHNFRWDETCLTKNNLKSGFFIVQVKENDQIKSIKLIKN